MTNTELVRGATRQPGTRNETVIEAAERIGADVAARWADEVDRNARFPAETIDALRSAGLLSAMVPVELGGRGADLVEIAAVTTELGRHCASSAMIFAMHQIQVACLVRHGQNSAMQAFARRLVDEQLLVASATTEIGSGGDVRTSTCAVETVDGSFRLSKVAPVISYGMYADAILVTARRDPGSPPSDQSLVLVLPPGLTLETTSGWDTLGFRGTCSLGFRLTAEGDVSQIFEHPYADISASTMLPVSHLLWTSLWLGIALAAADKARRFVQAEARKKVGTVPPGALRLAELMVNLQQLSESVHGMTARYVESSSDPVAVTSMAFAVTMNTLKVSASTLALDVVNGAMLICGLAGYKQDSPFSLGRLLRDAHGAAVMVNNDRLLSNNAQLLLALKEL